MIRSFFHIWFLGIVSPARAFDELRDEPAPFWGLWATLIRWGGQSLTAGVLSLVLLGEPSTPAHLDVPFLTDANYYRFALLFAPLFGLGIWLLWSGIVHVVLRAAGRESDMDQILNVVGAASLIPAPLVWLWDSGMIALDRLFAPEAGVVHVALALWGLALLTIGFNRNLGVRVLPAAGLSVMLLVVYVPLAMVWIR